MKNYATLFVLICSYLLTSCSCVDSSKDNELQKELEKLELEFEKEKKEKKEGYKDRCQNLHIEIARLKIQLEE